MKFQSQIISSGSGSIGGCTYSRNRSGQYIRRRSMPVNSGSSFAQEMTANFATLIDRWTIVLTSAERTSWDVWAANTPQIDSLGNSIIWTGQNAFVSMNSFRMQNGQVILDDAPSIFAGTSLLAAAMGISGASEATQDFDLGFSNVDEWAGAVGGILGVYVSRPQNTSINYFKGPYRLAATVIGAVVPPTSPVTVVVPFPITAGQRIFMQARASAADGRISSVARFSNIVGA